MTSFQDRTLTERLFDRDSKNLLENAPSSPEFSCEKRRRTRLRRIGRGCGSTDLYTSLFLLVVLLISALVSASPLHYESSDSVRTLPNYYSPPLGRVSESRAMLDKSLVNYNNRTSPSHDADGRIQSFDGVLTPSRSTQNVLRVQDEGGRYPPKSATQFLRRSSRTSTSRSRQTTADDPVRRDNYHSFSSPELGRSPSNLLKEPRLSGDEMPVCSHVGDYTNEISAKAYLAGTVFEGKARSKSKVLMEGTYAVTFVVQRVHKDQTSGLNPTPLKVRSQVRLNFSEKARTPKFAQCDQSYDLAPVRPGEFVRAHIKQGRRYIVFVNGVGPHNYTVLGEPVLKKKKSVQAVKDVLCPKCVRPVSVEGLRDLKLKVKEQLTLVCKCKGNPLPILQWFKNGARIRASKRMKIQFKKRRSLLVIPKVQMDDAGKYECRGTGVSGAVVSSSAIVTVHLRPENATLWPLLGGPCPIDSYCLNGGTCTYYETVGEPVCQCAEGFNGQRCESKDVYNRSSMYNKPSMTYNCKLGFSSTYYC